MASFLACLVLALGVVVARGADRLLFEASWTSRNPQLARRLWHACAASHLGCWLAFGLLLAHDVWEHWLLWVTGAAKPDLHLAYAGTREVSATWNWAALLGVVSLAGPAVVWAVRLRIAERTRRAHRLLPGRRQRCGDAVLVLLPSPGSSLYCLPGRRLIGSRPHLVIASEDAWARLTPPERQAALAHELAHLRHRHHRSVSISEAFVATMGRLGVLRHYALEVRRLVELEADDDAGRAHGRRTVASALLTLSTKPGWARPPESALGLGSRDVGRRILRLLEPCEPTGLVLRASAGVAAAVLVSLPPALLGTPLLLLI